MHNTNDFFTPGKLSIIMDAGAGSSGKGKIGSFICEHADNWQFACNTFYPQAGHWVRLDDGREFFYQSLNSCAYMVHKYEKIYIGPGSIIELPALLREIKENNVPDLKLGIDPMVAVLQDKDSAYERGEVDLDGVKINNSTGTMKYGSTSHGVGAARVRRILRRDDCLLAKNIPELQKYLCDVPAEIMTRLKAGQSGLLEIAQGFQLSNLLDEFYPYTTSRNCTVAAGFDDMMVPPVFAGNILLNFRTFPIRISNYKYICDDTKKHLTWSEVQEYTKLGKKFTKFEGNSGHGYGDQIETSWEDVTRDSGSKTPIVEMTSVTKLPRRVFTFSKENFWHAIKHNDTGHKIYISINFVNYIDARCSGARDSCKNYDKITNWVDKVISSEIEEAKRMGYDVCLKYLGTGARTDDTIVYEA